MNHYDEVWMEVVRNVIDVPARERIHVVSRLILSSSGTAAAKVSSELLTKATNMIRVNVPINEWVPAMMQAKDENPLVTVVPLDLKLCSPEDVEVVKQACNAGLHVRSIYADVRLDTASFQELKTIWEQHNLEN